MQTIGIKLRFTFVLLTLFRCSVYSQSKDSISFDTFKTDILSKYGISIYSQETLNPEKLLPINILDLSIEQILSEVESIYQVKYLYYNEHIVLLLSDTKKNKIPDKKDIKKYKLTGQLRDAEDGNIVKLGTVFILQKNLIINTDSTGYFEVQLERGLYNIKVVGLGTYENNFEIDLLNDVDLDIELFEKTLELEEVLITTKAPDINIVSLQSGSYTLDLTTLKKIPTFLGEVDVSRAVLLLPGVSTVGEGSTGFNVRGGGIDQNLILMDGIPLYNSSHLLGFFSAFNPDFIKDFTLYKGFVPVDKGGRVSSVLEVNQKIPQKEKVKFNAGIGPVTSKIFLDVPLKKEKAGVIIGARAAYPNYILSFFPDESNVSSSSANYFDINAKYDQVLNNGSSITFSGYYSTDEFTLSSDTSFNYSSLLLGLSYSGTFKGLGYNLKTSYTGYDASVEDQTANREANFENGINQASLKGSLDYEIGDQLYRAGLEANYYKFLTGEIEPTSINSEAEFQELSNENAFDFSIFADAKIKLSENFSVLGGIRLTSFYNVGSSQFLQFMEDQLRSNQSVTDTVSLSSGEFERVNTSFEPRFSVNYRLNSSSSIKGSFNRSFQYLHLFSNTIASLPSDLWRPSTPNLEPLSANQISLGYFKNFKSNNFETSIEAFYKEIDNSVDFQDGTFIPLNEELPFETLNGETRSYGLELLLAKNTGKFTGRLAYTFSRAESRFRSSVIQENLNDGNLFPANFDKPHSVDFSGNLKLGKLASFSASFTYSSGRPVTLPQGQFSFGNTIAFTGVSRNNFRIPDFHRLDIAFTIEGTHKKNVKFETSWTFSVYNLYGRRNAFSVFVNSTDGLARQLSVLGSPFPSITFNLKLR